MSEGVQIDYLKKTAVMTINVDITDWENAPTPNGMPTYKRGLLEINGLEYFSMPIPGERFRGLRFDSIGLDMSEGYYDEVKIFPFLGKRIKQYMVM